MGLGSYFYTVGCLPKWQSITHRLILGIFWAKKGKIGTHLLKQIFTTISFPLWPHLLNISILSEASPLVLNWNRVLCYDGASLFQWSLIDPMRALLFQWNIVVSMKPHSSDVKPHSSNGALFQFGALLSRWSLTVPMESDCTNGVDWSSLNGPIKCQF